MNRTGVFFEGWSSRHLYNTKLTPETPRLSPGLKEKYYDENLGEKMLRKYLEGGLGYAFYLARISSCSIPVISVLMSREGQGSE